jgi:hypothetical protein
VGLLARYRATGADPPWGDLLRAHPGVRMEGYFWRFTDPGSARVLIALCGVNRARDGSWSTLGLAAHPGGFLRTVAHPEGFADPEALGARAGEAFDGRERTLVVALGDDARLDVRIDDPQPWTRRSLGGSSVFQLVPALNQYWHPWLLGGRAGGSAVVGGERWELDGWQAYAERNWGAGGFPEAWWWGQAQAFSEHDACVAFAGGRIRSGPLRTEVTAVVVRLPGGRLLRLGDPVVSPTRAVVGDERWSLRARGLRWSVEIEGGSPLGSAHVLPVPLPLERRNVPGAIEHLGGRMEVVVRDRGRVAWRGASELAALEHGGIERAVAEVRRRGAAPRAAGAAPV